MWLPGLPFLHVLLTASGGRWRHPCPSQVSLPPGEQRKGQEGLCEEGRWGSGLQGGVAGMEHRRGGDGSRWQGLAHTGPWGLCKGQAVDLIPSKPRTQWGVSEPHADLLSGSTCLVPRADGVKGRGSRSQCGGCRVTDKSTRRLVWTGAARVEGRNPGASGLRERKDPLPEDGQEPCGGRCAGWGKGWWDQFCFRGQV